MIALRMLRLEISDRFAMLTSQYLLFFILKKIYDLQI